MREVQAQVDAPARTTATAGHVQTQVSPMQTRNATVTTPPPARWTQAERTHDAQIGESAEMIASPTPPEQATSHVLIEHVREEPAARNTLQPILPATILPAQKAPKPARATAEPSQPAQAAARQTPAIEEHTQTITISIGRVEVRNTPPPAPAPSRRPAFKPGMSLDAFLGRGRSDER